jgi:O-antigen ligase
MSRDTIRPRLDGLREGVIGKSKPFPLFLVYAFWVLTIFEVDLFLTATTGGPFYRIPLLLAPVLGLSILNRGDKRIVYWTLILFTLMHLGASLLAENAGASRDGFKFMVYMLLLFAGSASFLDSPSKLIVILKLYLLSFAWYGLQGMPSGLGGLRRGAGLAGVAWHPLLANEDSYGPLMVISMAFSYFFALATSSPRWRLLSRGIFVLSVLGVMASFARGAALAAGAVLVHISLRSPRRARALIGLVLATIALLTVGALVFPLDAYIQNLRSVSEGDEVRTTLWQLAWNVFQQSPLYGVGAFNFGVVAARITPFDVTRTVGKDPAQLYRFAVHNPHMQILAEEGIIGIALWTGMIAGFFRWNRRLRTGDARALWSRRGGEDLDVRMIGRGLEGAMVGYLATSVFYNQLYIHWFWSLLTISYVLAGLTVPTRGETEGQVSGHSVTGSRG